MGEYARGSADGPLKIFGRLNINKLLRNSKASDTTIESDSSSVLKDFATQERSPYQLGVGNPIDYHYQGASDAYARNFLTDINSQSFSGDDTTPYGGSVSKNIPPQVVQTDSYTSQVSVYHNGFGSPRIKTAINESMSYSPSPLSQPVIDPLFRDATHIGPRGEFDLSEEGATLLKWKLNSHMPPGHQVSKVNVKTGSIQQIGMEIDSVVPSGFNPNDYARSASDENWSHAHDAWNKALSSSGEENQILSSFDRDVFAYSKGGKLPFKKALRRYHKDMKNTIMSRVRKNKNIPLTLSGKPNTSKMLSKVGLRRTPDGSVFDNRGRIVELEVDDRDSSTLSHVLGSDFDSNNHETVSHLAYIHAHAAREFSKKMDEGYSVLEADKAKHDYIRSSCKDLYSVMTKNSHKSFAESEDSANKAAEVLSRMKVITY